MALANKIGVIIATSMGRVESLFNVALNSVMAQTVRPEYILIVDDNTDMHVSLEIENRIRSVSVDSIVYIKNSHTKNMSGTGAWNTGIEFLIKKLGSDSYAAILDDDDSWEPDYIEILNETVNKNQNALAVFAYLKRSDCKDVLTFQKSDLTVENFLKGNPGVQGSNMCFKLRCLKEIGGFDENLASCTDRDLMIRFLQKFTNENIYVIGKQRVLHFAHSGTVTSNFEKKKIGLNYFYQKHIRLFDFITLKYSLSRAERLFNYTESNRIIGLYRKSKTILITGVCGLIGSYTARKMLHLGYSVVGIDNLELGVMENIKDLAETDNFRFEICSILDISGLKRIFQSYSIEYVFHFAALPRIKFSIDFPEKSHETNVTGAENIARIAVKHNVRLFVFASSSSVYGEGSGASMGETDVCHPISPYAKQKAEAEQRLTDVFNKSESNLLILRLFNVFGYSSQPLNKYSSLIARGISKVVSSEVMEINGNGMHRRDFNYIDDVCDAFVCTMEKYRPKHRTEIINIGKGKNHSVNEIISILESVVGKKCKKSFRDIDYIEPTYTLANNTKARELLEWTPVGDMKKGIRLVVKQTIENEEIVIGVAMHNNATTIRRCLLSILKQRNLKRKLRIVLANDHSVDLWQNEIKDLLEDARILLLNVSFQNVVKTRNAINSYIEENIRNVAFIGRLDADDEYASEFSLSEIETVFDQKNCQAVLAGNYLRQNGLVIERTNRAQKKMSDMDYVLERLRQMSENESEGELPSCNLFVRPNALVPYPNVASGEDHALLVHYLTNQDKYNLYLAEDLLPVIYSLDGSCTKDNKKAESYIGCRKELYHKTLELCITKDGNKRH